MNFEKTIEIKENGNKVIKLSKKCSGVLGHMKTNRSNIYIIKNNKSKYEYTMCIRNDGLKPFECKLGQLSFLDKEDLIKIKEMIDEILK